MRDSSPKPVFFLAFANDRNNRLAYLRNLSDEARRLRETLEQAQASGLCEIVLRESATWEDIRKVFHDPQYRNRIALFHYGGHANGYQLLLETAEGKTAAAHAVGLAAFFGQQRELEVVFLNGCSTEPQVQNLLDEGISVVIATSQAIDDKVAAEFATCFYQSMAIGSPLSTAFAEAVGAVKIPRGNETRHFYYSGMQPEVADRWPWALHLRRGSEEMAQWNLPALVDNQLFGLPPLPTLDLPNSPYRYLDWYRREDAELFFGRGHAIRELYTSLTAADSAPIILFYGQSGVGKSSLLAAGLLPRLEKSHTLAYLRRDQTKGLLGTLTSQPSPLCSTTQRLDWQGAEARAGRPLLVVLDQVEEFRTRPNGNLPQEMDQLLEALQEVFSDPVHRPQGKLLLSFRKEWLAEIEKQLAEVKLPHAKVFLKRLDRRGIIDVVMGPTRVERLQKHFGLTVEEGLAELIADDLLADQEAAVAPTLQILLKKLWSQAKVKIYEPPVFSRELYDQVRKEGLGLGDFLDQQLAALRQIETLAVDSGLSLDLLFFHTTDQGTAEQHTVAELRDAYCHQQAVLPGLLHQCKALYLLTEPDQGGPGSEPMTRLAHDTLAPLVRARHEISDAPGQRARRILESRVVHINGGEDSEPSLEPLAEVDLALVETGVAGMRALDRVEQKLVELSRKNREEQKQLRLLEQQRREQQQKKTQRALFGLALAIMVALGLFTVWQIRVLVHASDLALNEARRQTLEAERIRTEDPVEAIYRNLAIVPEPAPAAGRPYVPDAESSLYQAMRSSLEQEYLDVSTPPLKAEQVAFAGAQIAVGNSGLRLVPHDLSAAGIITLPQSLKEPQDVAWNEHEDALLAWNHKAVQVWLPTRQLFEFAPEFRPNEVVAEVTCAKWRPSSNQIAICRGDSLWLWSYETGASQRLYASSTNKDATSTTIIEDAHWSPDGNHLAIRNGLFALMLWDGQRMRQLYTQPTDTSSNAINDIGWSTDGQHFVAAFKDGTAWVWPMESLQNVLRVRLGNRAGKYRVEFLGEKQFVSWVSGLGSRVHLWSVDSTTAIRTFGLESDNLQDVVISPDKLSLLTLMLNGMIRGWDLGSGASLFGLQGHTSKVLSVDWLEGTPYLATSSQDGTAQVWDTRTEVELVALHGHTSRNFGTSPHVTVRWHQDGHHLLTYGEDSTIRMWRVLDDHGKPMCEGMQFCYGFSETFSEADARISTARWLDSDPNIIIATDESESALRIKLPSLKDEVLATRPDQGSIVEWSTNGEWVLQYDTGKDGTLWKFSTQDAITVRGPLSYAKWLDIGLLVSQGPGNAQLIPMNSGPEAGQALPVKHNAEISAAQAHGDLVATGDLQGAIWIWRYQANDTPFLLDTREQFEDQGPISELQWNSTGTHLLSSDATKITLWDVEKQNVLKEWFAASVAAFSPDGSYVAVATSRSFLVFDIQSGKESPSISAHSNEIQGIQWVVGKQWSNQDLYSPMVASLLRWLQGQPWTRPPTRLLIATWSNDRTVQVWEWGSIRNPAVAIAHLSSSSGLKTVALNADGSRLLTIDNAGVLRIWRMWLNDPIELRRDAEKLMQQRTH